MKGGGHNGGPGRATGRVGDIQSAWHEGRGRGELHRDGRAAHREFVGSEWRDALSLKKQQNVRPPCLVNCKFMLQGPNSDPVCAHPPSNLALIVTYA